MSRRIAVIGVAIAGLSTVVLAGPTATAQASIGVGGEPAVPSAPAKIAGSTNFAGYGFKGNTVTSAAATFTVPAITCTSAERGVAAGVFLIGSSPVFTSGLAEAVCASGTAQYAAGIYVNNVLATNLTVGPNDKIAVTVTETSTIKWFIADDSIYNGSVELGVPEFTSNAFTSASVDGTPLGSFTPRTKYERVKGSTVQLVPTSITAGENFNVLFKHK
jgi:hypothetical protein